MREYYSRRKAIEEKKNLKKSITFIALSIAILLALLFLGLPLTAKFAAFISELTSKDNPITVNDNTPPAPPRFDNLPDATSKEIIEVTGTTEEGAIVYIFLNGKENEIVADSYGEFTFSADLTKGENIIYGRSKDKSGNESTESKTYSILFDNEEPEISIESPSDGTEFFGNNQKEIEIKGKTEANVNLTVNERFISLDDEGNFKYKYTLSEGTNELKFVALDEAENKTEKVINVNFTP